MEVARFKVGGGWHHQPIKSAVSSPELGFASQLISLPVTSVTALLKETAAERQSIWE